MGLTVRKRTILLGLSILVFLAAGWLSIFLQQKQHLIGGGINRVFLFLLINAHLIISIIFLYLIIRQSIKLVLERRKKVPGSAFKRNLFFAFIIFSVIPVGFVFLVAGKFITNNIDHWFHARLDSGLKNGLLLHEQQTIRERNALTTLGRSLKEKITSKNEQECLSELGSLEKKYPYQIYIWEMDGAPIYGSIRDEVRVWRKFRKVNDRSTKSLLKKFFLKIRPGGRSFDFFGSLYWVSPVSIKDRKVLLSLVHRYPEHIRTSLIEVQNAIGDYSQLKSMRNPIYWSYFLTFLLVTLLILFLSIWCAFYLARGISKPIKDLLLAIRKIRKGDFDVQVTVHPTDDLAHLVRGFNEMTSSLKRAYKHLEFQNSEMLTMLEHIKESVFFINNYGRLLSFNAAAKKLIQNYLSISRFKNRRVSFLGEYVTTLFFSLIRELKKSEKSYLSKEVSFVHGGETKTFLIYLTIVQNAILGEKQGILVIIEDLSEMYKINKMKTWREAAKQMAHEIKNPLTPIQLATQRLQRKLRKQGECDPALMDCAETILRQVKIIKGLVAHFSEFAKMPGTVIEPLDINKIIKEVVALYEISYPDITFSYDLQKFLPLFKADKKKMKRVVVNLLDNSVRALRNEKCEKKIFIKTQFRTNRNQVELLISDSGPGIPPQVREKLFLPYVSTENKNMGLGLAIVHDIVSRSGGSVKLLPTLQGATFQILIPV
jgi:two-component system nitrogen regulation sensor histidine kinase NtrY